MLRGGEDGLEETSGFSECESGRFVISLGAIAVVLAREFRFVRSGSEGSDDLESLCAKASMFSLSRELSEMIVGTVEPETCLLPAPNAVAAPKKELRPEVGELKPGLVGPCRPGDGPRYMLVTTLAAGQSELPRLCCPRVDGFLPNGILGAVCGSSVTFGSSSLGT